MSDRFLTGSFLVVDMNMLDVGEGAPSLVIASQSLLGQYPLDFDWSIH